jgi:GNAT superfamily N-acetyltransferase
VSQDVTLRELTTEEYADYRVQLWLSYVDEMVELGRHDRAAAERRAQRDQDSSLPEGGPPDGQTIRLAEHDGVRIGQIWIGPATDNDPDAPHGQRFGWLNDVEVVEGLRGQGWGRALLAAAEQLARDEGYARLGLSVFGGNETAIRLYVSDGYELMQQQMVKDL